MKMALRLRKDVQKASYYVWFLGAQEAKGLRGSKVLLPAIPKLLERARIQEPLKVTLQISHKGLKIIQGSTKHFIPHGAITCSMQTDDIVACVLLLYNPATKCPLHVHAYRCDSEATAIALNDQLQILINRPDNQKRFNELESRLGYQSTPSSVPSSEPIPTKPKQVTRRYESPRRFDSSLGSDTGTSTRESECSEEHSPTGPKSPLAHAGSTKLFDSLAAELRAKLNGNGPPLLLPPRDYDTVHRSQGNLAAIELRRCRNQCIVGNNIKNTKQVVSSRGSSGIGSDLAPSPERHDGQSSSDEDWVNDHQESVIIMPATQTRHKKEEYPKQSKPISTYIYPREPVNNKNHRYQRSSSRENNSSPKGSLNSHEEEVKPVLTKPVPLENRFREVFKMKDYDERKKYSSDEDRIVVEERHHASKGRPQPKYLPEIEPVEVYKKPYIKNGKRETDYRGNKTDKQKYKELTENRYRTSSPIHHQEGYKGYRAASPERTKSLKRYESRGKDVEPPSHRRESYREPPIDDGYRYRNRSSEPTRYRDNSSPPPLIENYPSHNPYKQHEALPYRESMDKMMKSPVMRYKSFGEDTRYSQPQDSSHNKNSWELRGKRASQNGSRHSRDISPPELYRDDSRHHFVQVHAKPHMIDSMTPDSTLQKKSPRDRFQNAKEKFQAMERDREIIRNKQSEPVKMQRKVINEMFDVRGKYHSNGWSSDEEISRPTTRNAYKELPVPPQPTSYGMDPPGRMLPAKSLGNLVKGYRHSYAEPRNFPRVSGRVGLAAVNPY